MNVQDLYLSDLPVIGVDLDGTLAEHDQWQGFEHIGKPVPTMLERVRGWLTKGHPVYGRVEVQIVTARVARDEPDANYARGFVEAYCEHHLGQKLVVTSSKSLRLVELWDDRAVQVEANTGRRLDGVED